MIRLPDVTVVAIDGVARPLTQMAIDATLAQIEPADVLFPDEAPKTALDADKLLWWTCSSVKTSHMLVIQYDGFVIDGSMWKPEYLEYDYIGAPWPHHGQKVGNGGFSLRSRRLMQYLDDRNAKFPPKTPEDEAICHEYRETLVSEGFSWAPTSLAYQFSFERSPKRRSFGFHGMHNVIKVLPRDKFEEWLAKAPREYVESKLEWQELKVLADQLYDLAI
jgi:Protein of unknown function (DUF5672)